MAFENTELFEHIAEQAIKKYDFPNSSRAKILQFSENATYLVYDSITQENLGALRISRPGYHTLEELKSEITWLKQIKNDTPVVVANPLKGIDGSSIQSIQGADGREYHCIMTEFLTGTTPDENDEPVAVKQFAALGETTAYLHRHTQRWKGTVNLQRIHWTYHNMVGDTPVWGRWQAAKDLTPEMTVTLTRTTDIIKKRLECYGRNDDNYGLIHADLRLANLLMEGEEIKVIDFDDCGFGWYLHDLASSVSFIETKPIVPELIDSWLEGYRKILPFHEKDFKEIDTFIMQRRLQLMAWLASHEESTPVKELSVGFTEGTMELAERYLQIFG